MKKRILISAGEPSGDIHAFNLVREILSLRKDTEFFGIGCENLDKLGVKLARRMDRMAIIGLWEAILSIFSVKKLLSELEQEIKKNGCDLAVLVDYPGFNLALARILKKYKVPVVYYIAPQVWAWGAFRTGIIKKLVKKVVVILPFEEAIYKKSGIDVDFAGHPILDDKLLQVDRKEAKRVLGIPENKFVITLLPGSRPLEVKKHLDVMLSASGIIQKELKDAHILASRSGNIDEHIFKDAFERNKGFSYNDNLALCLSAADFVISASGTVTLQAAIFEKPMVITYITSPFTYFAARLVVTLPYISLVNIIAGRHVVPELLQFEATPENISATALDIIRDKSKMSKMISDLKQVKASLGSPGASKKAAQIIVNLLS